MGTNETEKDNLLERQVIAQERMADAMEKQVAELKELNRKLSSIIIPGYKNGICSLLTSKW